jgi:ubiquinone/menaquinone biosynthesis C-methylase UbiE
MNVHEDHLSMDEAALLTEIGRVLKPGGRIGATSSPRDPAEC